MGLGKLCVSVSGAEEVSLALSAPGQAPPCTHSTYKQSHDIHLSTVCVTPARVGPHRKAYSCRAALPRASSAPGERRGAAQAHSARGERPRPGPPRTAQGRRGGGVDAAGLWGVPYPAAGLRGSPASSRACQPGRQRWAQPCCGDRARPAELGWSCRKRLWRLRLETGPGRRGLGVTGAGGAVSPGVATIPPLPQEGLPSAYTGPLGVLRTWQNQGVTSVANGQHQSTCCCFPHRVTKNRSPMKFKDRKIQVYRLRRAQYSHNKLCAEQAEASTSAAVLRGSRGRRLQGCRCDLFTVVPSTRTPSPSGLLC
ncbi:uncharacterized protein LOC128916007 [Rissa tridactyla]|uniref:uncharacterized protein LOC128916007 n=1 Tax=Rissa tridactyla TaxID=75485 RepID=UPI0023BABDF6|nr:uncharacterized protein LOC128916007 [Rissa tridactyla]